MHENELVSKYEFVSLASEHVFLVGSIRVEKILPVFAGSKLALLEKVQRQVHASKPLKLQAAFASSRIIKHFRI